MRLTVINCAKNYISVTEFSKVSLKLAIIREISIPLEASADSWISQAISVLEKLLNKTSLNQPTIINLPSFSLLTKIIRVPKVAWRNQHSIINLHIQQILTIENEHYFAYAIVNENTYDLEVAVTIVYQDWLKTFSEAIQSLKLNIHSFQSSSINHFNAFQYAFPDYNKNVLFLVSIPHALQAIFISGARALSFHSLESNNLEGLLSGFYKKYPDVNLDEIFVSGEISKNLKDLLPTLPTHFPILGKEVASMGAAANFFFKNGIFMDLLPKPIRTKLLLRKNKFKILLSTTILGCSLIFWGLVFNAKTNEYNRLSECLKSRLLEIKQVTIDIRSLNNKLVFLGEALRSLNEKDPWPHFLTSLNRCIKANPGVNIHGLKISSIPHTEAPLWEDELPQKNFSKNNNYSLDLSGTIDPSNSQAPLVIRNMIQDISKLDYIEETNNLLLDTSAQIPHFSFSLQFNPSVFLNNT